MLKIILLSLTMTYGMYLITEPSQQQVYDIKDCQIEVMYQYGDEGNPQLVDTLLQECITENM